MIYNQPAMNHKSTSSLGYPIALLSAVFLSTTAIFIRYLTLNYQLPALVLALWRDVFVAITLVVFFGLFNRRLFGVSKQNVRYLALYGLMLAIFNALWTLSVALNGAALSTVLVYCSAGFTVLLGWWLLRERPNWGRVVAIVLSLGGCVLVSGAYQAAAWQTNWMGILTGVFSGLMYAIYSLMGRAAAQRQLNPWTTLLYTFGFAAVFLLAANLLPGGLLPGSARLPGDIFWLEDAWVGWGVLFILAAVPTVAGFGLYNTSLTYLPSSVANLVVTLEPAFTAVIAFIAFGEVLSGIQMVGGVLILGGVLFLRVYEGKDYKKRNRQDWEDIRDAAG